MTYFCTIISFAKNTLGQKEVPETQLNWFAANVAHTFLLKQLEILWFLDVLRGYRIKEIGQKRVNKTSYT